ncbi:MAG: hypothetical protein J5382_01485 [Bacteroidales bacterium]|nr:hypothetical protein [Bacteroidales bacterium]
MKQLFRNIIALLFLSAFLLTACNLASHRRVQAVLDDVESYISDRPDSALAVLRALPQDDVRGREQRARTALLHSIALDKCAIDLRTDSIIEPAVLFYSRHGAQNNRMKTAYYLGRIEENARNYNEAIVSYMKAETLSSGSGDEHFKGMISMAIARIYQATYNRKLAYDYQEQGKLYFLNAGDTTKYYMAIGTQAITLQAQDKWEQADSLFREALDHTQDQPSAQGLFLSNYALMKVLQPAPEPGEAISLLAEKMNRYHISLSREDYGTYAYAMAQQGEYDDAEAILGQIKGAENQNYWHYRIALLRGDYEEAIQYLNASYLENDQKLARIFSESLPESLGHFYKESAEAERLKRTNLLKDAVILLILFSFIATLMFYRQHSRRRAMEERLEELTSMSEDLQRKMSDLRQPDSSKNEFQRRYVKSFKDQFKLLDSLCAAYWSPVRKSQKDKIYDEVKGLLDIMDKDTGRQQELENILNENLDGIMRKMRKDLPDLREQDYRLIAYSLLGFRSKTIAAIMGYTGASVNTMKSKIRQMVSNLESENRDFYLLYL